MFFRFVTMHALDRQTDRQTEFSSLERVCIPCSAVKMLIAVIAHAHHVTMGLLEKLQNLFHLNSQIRQFSGHNYSDQRFCREMVSFT